MEREKIDFTDKELYYVALALDMERKVGIAGYFDTFKPSVKGSTPESFCLFRPL